MKFAYDEKQVAAIVTFSLLGALNTMALHNTKTYRKAVLKELRESGLHSDPRLPDIERILGLTE